MAIKIPDTLKADIPPTLWGKVLAATPVVMTVVATLLAGLASSEMTRAQYTRSLGAQQQSKAGDQWAFFQAKHLRGALERNALDILKSTADVQPFALRQPKTPIRALNGELPDLPPAPVVNPHVTAALDAMEAQLPADELARLLGSLQDKTLEAALHAAVSRSRAFDQLTGPINQAVARAGESPASLDKAWYRDYTAARLQYTADRYDAEARLNQAIANLYELQVRKSNLDAERHHTRSQQFFFGMLAAQAGVIIATFAMAARKRNWLWLLAAAAGLSAVSFAVYVYLCV